MNEQTAPSIETALADRPRIVRALKQYDITVTERNISNWKVMGGCAGVFGCGERASVSLH